ncbi:hypothetical protein SAMN04324258_4281 [Krasilnikoviella flava]|uniref:Sensor protein KdpD transmembrane domain-containing protein n=1 Tax=Krasilnikoviella flava TaxID=526729 RepID=A0A1T5M0W7_9MICO|nr:hypothetical protein SAMN04324258_4281 [Krasilnikoviella flava]
MPWAALLVPLAACAVLAAFRDSVANTNAALGLVLVVVAFAATGRRLAGVLAALSCGVWFDFFLTEPYQRLTIDDPADVETAVLLLVVGVAVTEIALWGRRQQARASERAGYLGGIVTAARTVADGVSTDGLVGAVERQIVEVLGIDACRFDPGTAPSPPARPRLHGDGTVTRDGRPVDVERDGLPVDDVTELLVEHGGVVHGRYLLTSSTRVCRPDLDRRLVAATLAGQVGAALTGPRPTT